MLGEKLKQKKCLKAMLNSLIKKSKQQNTQINPKDGFQEKEREKKMA